MFFAFVVTLAVVTATSPTGQPTGQPSSNPTTFLEKLLPQGTEAPSSPTYSPVPSALPTGTPTSLPTSTPTGITGCLTISVPFDFSHFPAPYGPLATLGANDTFNLALTQAVKLTLPGINVIKARARTAGDSFYCLANTYRRRLLAPAIRGTSALLIFDIVFDQLYRNTGMEQAIQKSLVQSIARGVFGAKLIIAATTSGISYHPLVTSQGAAAVNALQSAQVTIDSSTRTITPTNSPTTAPFTLHRDYSDLSGPDSGGVIGAVGAFGALVLGVIAYLLYKSSHPHEEASTAKEGAAEEAAEGEEAVDEEDPAEEEHHTGLVGAAH